MQTEQKRITSKKQTAAAGKKPGKAAHTVQAAKKTRAKATPAGRRISESKKTRKSAAGRKNRRASTGTAVYYGLMLLAVIAILGVSMYYVNYFQDSLAAYEASQIKYVLEQTAKPIVEKNYLMFSQYEDQSIFLYETLQQYVSYMRGLLDDKEITYSEHRTNETDRKTYTIRADGLRIGEFYLRHTHNDKYNNPIWEADGMKLELLQPQTYTIEAPTQSTVYVNGEVLDDMWVIESDIPEFEISIDAPAVVTIPTRRVFRFDRYFGLDSVKVVDRYGVENPLVQDGNHYTAAMNYDDERMAGFDERVEEVAKKISCYMSDDMSLYYTAKDLVKESPAVKKLEAFDIRWIMSHKDYEFLNMDVSNYLSYSDEIFSVETRFDFKIIYYTVDPEYYPTAYRLYFQKQGDTWRVFDFELL